MNYAEHARSVCDHQRCAAAARNTPDDSGQLSGRSTAVVLHEFDDLLGRALANLTPIEVDAAHARLSRERDELCVLVGKLAAAEVELALGERSDRATLGRFIGERRELRRVGQFLDRYLEHRDEL